LELFVSGFDFLDPKQPKIRIVATHDDVVKDVKEFIKSEGLEQKKKIAKRSHFKWQQAKYKYNTFDRLTTWEAVLSDLGLQIAKPAKVSDEDFLNHYLEIAQHFRRTSSKDLFEKYHAEVKHGRNWTLIDRWGAKKFHSLAWDYVQGEKTLHDISAAKSSKRKPISPKLRAEVLERDNYRCVKCGADAKSSGTTLHLNHRLPVSKGGKNSLENLETTCADCNLGMSDRIISAHQ
jgi:hypothetical protein